MNCAVPIALFAQLAIGAQPPLPAPQSYPVRPSPSEIAPGPTDPGVEAMKTADLLARDYLVGTWQATYFEIDGQSRPDVAAGLHMRFTRGRLELMQSGRPAIVVAYNVNPSKTPSGFLWKVPNAPGITFQDGIYSQEGNTVTICLAAVNAPAATQFLTQPSDGRTLFVLQRVNP
jgi:uncharacterized protein (TIGR03067 family)